MVESLRRYEEKTRILDPCYFMLHRYIVVHVDCFHANLSPISIGLCSVMANVHNHHFLIFLIGGEMSGSPTLFYTRSPRIKVTMSKNA